MSRLAYIYIICIAAALFRPMKSWGEEVAAATDDMLRDDYIHASLLVISPSAEVYSLVGHCALRLECPSQQMDYCFTFETSTDTQGLARFLMGTAKGGFLASKTSDYLNAYREARRDVTAYTLNLMPEEKLRLWQTVDEEMTRGFCHNYGYLHTQCTSMIVTLLSRTLKGGIEYHEPADIEQASFRDMMLTATDSYPWSTFFWQTILGPEGDETTPLSQKLTPLLLPQAWQRATVTGGGSERHLLDNAPERCIVANASKRTPCPTPLALFTTLFIIIVAITLGQYKLGWQLLPHVTDGVLLAAHTLMSIFLTCLWLFSRQEGTSWNWYLIVFNLLPLTLWLVLPAWRIHILVGTLGLVALQLLLTPFVPQLDLPHGVATACLAPRLAILITNKKIKK